MSGDYIVVEFETFRTNPDAKPSECRIHRTKEMLDPQRLGLITFPLAEYRLQQTREISDDPGATKWDPWRPPVIQDPKELPTPRDGPKRKPDLRGQGGETDHG